MLVILLSIVLPKTIFIFIAKILKNQWFGDAKMASKIGFFELWGSLLESHFSHHILHGFCHNFLSIFGSPDLEK